MIAKNSSVYYPTLHIYKYGKIYRVGLYIEQFYAIIPTLFPSFLLICYPYPILGFFLLAYSITVSRRTINTCWSLGVDIAVEDLHM